jgi:alpha-galactosidase
MAEWAGVDPSMVSVPAPAGGLNHCAFMLDVRLQDGRSAFPLMLEHPIPDVIRWGLERYSVLPYCWSHVTEFFPAMSHLVERYQGKLQGLEMQYGIHVHEMDHERARGERWERLVQTWVSGPQDDISLDVLPSGEAIEVVQIIEALLTNSNATHIINVPNQGAIANLPADAVVEVTSVVGAYGVQPVHVGELPEPLAATLRNHITTQQLTAEAALTGHYKTALQAFIQDPQTQARLAMPEIEKLMQALLDAHRQHLPQF